MKKQLKQTLIKIGLLAVVAAVIGVEAAQAQSLANQIRANIPFDFVVADKKLPAGKYLIRHAQPDSGGTVLAISSLDQHAFAITIPAQILTPKHKPMLVFHRYGDEYFLFQVWPMGASTGRVLRKSRRERELERKTRTLAATPLGTTKASETVCIVAGLQ